MTSLPSEPPGITQAPRIDRIPVGFAIAKDFISDGAKKNLGKRQTLNKQIRKKKTYPPVREKKQPKNSNPDSLKKQCSTRL